MSSKLSVLFIYGRHIGISDKLIGLYQLQYLEKAGRINLNIKAFWNVSYADLAGCDCVYACRLALYSLRWFFVLQRDWAKELSSGWTMTCFQFRKMFQATCCMEIGFSKRTSRRSLRLSMSSCLLRRRFLLNTGKCLESAHAAGLRSRQWKRSLTIGMKVLSASVLQALLTGRTISRIFFPKSSFL